jgi:predicted ribosome quality control (RQC) complex YloA/Tae2 family protein
MTTLSTLRKELILNNDKLINAKKLLQSMENDPALHFEDEMRDLYNEQLNETYSEQFENFPFPLGKPCDWIEENQPTDYRVGFADFIYDPSNNQEYMDLEEQIETLQNEIEDLEEEIEELENN